MQLKKTVVENRQNDHNCESNVDTCDHSADALSDELNLEIARSLGLCTGTNSDLATQETECQIHDLQNYRKSKTGDLVSMLLDEPSRATPQYIRDIENLTEAKLKLAYPAEFNSWRSRRDYAKKKSLPWYPAWNKFSAFLRDLGPIPEAGYTLDKIKPDSGYVPGNVRWASKETQTHNRPNTILLTHNNETHPLAVWADRTGQPESTLRWRFKERWTHSEIITGIRNSPPAKFKAPPPNHPWPVGHIQWWEAEYQRETYGHADRLRYFAYRVAKELKAMLSICETDDLDSMYYPDDYQPTEAERNALEKLTAELERWQRFWLHVKQQVEKRGGSISLDDLFLNRYR